MTRTFRRGITQDSVDYSHLRGRLDVEAVLEDLGIDIGFRPRENQIMCHCPDLKGNHKNGDANASFGVHEEKLAFNCFVCGGGNIIELVQMMRPEYARRWPSDIEKDQEAVKYLEQFADFNIGDDIVARVLEKLHQKEEVPEPMPEYPESNLFQYHKIHPYLYERGLTRDIIVEMQVGFDDEHCGIVIPHFFQGKLRGWQTRHMAMLDGDYICDYCQKHDKESSQYANRKIGKYKNTKNFPKLNTLYGYDRLKRFLQEGDGQSVIVVESPMTALKLMSMGFNRVVATFGSFSREQAMLLIAIPKVYFWPDNDGAGYENTERAIEFLSRYVALRIVPAVDKAGGDAADLANAENVSEYLQNAYSSSLFNLYKDGRKLPTMADVLPPNEQ